MSRTNYNNYSNYSKRPENRENTVEQPANAVADVETVIETIPETKPEVKPATPAKPAAPAKTITKKGVVFNCAKLNIRDGASITADPICVVDANSELVVYINENFGEFYKVCTASGVEGYCMKNYVSLK